MADLDIQIREHLSGFKERRKKDMVFRTNVEQYHRDNTVRLDNLVREMGEQTKTLTRIEEQTNKTNGRVSKFERNLLIVGTAVAVTIVLKFPELIAFLKFV